MRIFDESLESRIISLLHAHTMEAMEIVAALRKRTPVLTKQAVYQILRRLRKEEIIVLSKKSYVLSDIFIDRAVGFFEAARSAQKKSLRSDSFLNLSDGEYISYHFKNPYFADQFWAHAFSILSQFANKDMPIMVYNPHEWFFIAREASERSTFSIPYKSGIPTLLLIGHTDPLDKDTKKKMENELLQYHMKEMPRLKGNYYVNIFNDYLIEVWLSQKAAVAIDSWYKKTKILTEDARQELQAIINKEERSRMRISRDKKRATRLAKLFKKDFVLRANT